MVTLDAPIQFEAEAQVPPALRPGGDGVVWVFKECRSAGPNADMQMLLMNLKAPNPSPYPSPNPTLTVTVTLTLTSGGRSSCAAAPMRKASRATRSSTED